MNLYKKLLLAQAPDRAGVGHLWCFLGGGDVVSRLPLPDDLEGQLPQRACVPTNEGSHRADGQRGAFYGGGPT